MAHVSGQKRHAADSNGRPPAAEEKQRRSDEGAVAAAARQRHRGPTAAKKGRIGRNAIHIMFPEVSEPGLWQARGIVPNVPFCTSSSKEFGILYGPVSGTAR
jgi:hypothetical protein